MRLVFIPQICVLLLISCLCSGCFVYNYLHYKPRKINSSALPISHQQFDSLLQQHVSEAGWVNYEGFIRDSVAFNQYLNLLKNNHPNTKNWGKNDRLAYWINAYNAFTIQIICQNYPVTSIKDIEKKLINIPFGNTVWDLEFIKIENQTYNLNYLEHKILRKEFDEPRTHFAINCASFSCPPLLNRAYTTELLETQLQTQAINFVNDTLRNKISRDKAQLSKIFLWFKKDFTRRNSLKTFINNYSREKMDKNTEIDYLDYSWQLNKQ